MAHTVIWPKKAFFYPIGNTPAICLTDHLPPERSADILLLGCGDARNVLYTVHADHSPDRTLDFTCCDWEPAILARNIILYTFLADGEPADKLWNIYYHFFLDPLSLELLFTQCEKLLRFSSTLDTWDQSPYGALLPFCESYTLTEVRRHWTLYVQMKEMPVHAIQKMKSDFHKGMEREFCSLGSLHTKNTCRSAGPLCIEAVEILSSHFKHFWTMGITFGDHVDEALATHLNPTFVYSRVGNRFNVHYTSDPLQSFHLESAFISTPGSSPSIHAVVQSAKQQFATWCASFQARLVKSNGTGRSSLTIRSFVGDALAFCQALKDKMLPAYHTPWTRTRITLSQIHRAPALFDVINTSNLMDHLGLLNILLAATSLLVPLPSSVLHTDSLKLFFDSDSFELFGAQDTLGDAACADVCTLAVLIGIVPVSYLSNFASDSTTHADMLESMGVQPHRRVVWKHPPIVPENCQYQEIPDAQRLSQLLFGIYLAMFSPHEGTPTTMSMVVESMAVPSYTRTSFVLLLQLIQSRIRANWQQVFSYLLDLIRNDTTVVTSGNYYPELCCQLYCLGVFPGPVLSMPVGRHGLYQKWPRVPPVVAVVMKIPRSRIKRLEDLGFDAGTPPLECQLENERDEWRYMFSQLQFTFGRIVSDEFSNTRQVKLQEDPNNWQGTSDLIVTFHVPSWIIDHEPSFTKVNLAIRSAPCTLLDVQLRPMMLLFQTNLTDKENVFVCADLPDMLGLWDHCDPLFVRSSRGVGESSVDPAVITLSEDGQRVSAISKRVNFDDERACSALSGGAKVSMGQISSCDAEIAFGDVRTTLQFPFPVCINGATLRIARKSSYVEIVSPVLDPRRPSKLLFSLFPITMKNGVPHLWNLHYVNLDKLPILTLSPPNDWFIVHTALAFSDCQRKEIQHAYNTDRDLGCPLLSVRHSIVSILRIFAESKARVFALSHPVFGGICILFFVVNLRMDVSAHSVVAECFVLPLSETLVEKLSDALLSLTRCEAVTLRTSVNEMRTWKRLLPALTERCRDWEHLPHCEYLSSVPVTLEFAKSPICSCGYGHGTDAFLQIPEWRAFAPYVTRAALSPLFAVPFFEKVHNYTRRIAEPVRLSPFSSVPRCFSCGSTGNGLLRQCSRCKVARYCSKGCQVAHWREHRSVCLNFASS